MSQPAVTVCVATYRRPDRLARLLQRLGCLDTPQGGFEVVVVDDGSPEEDGVTEVLEHGAHSLGDAGIRMRFARQASNRGPGAARNVAWRMAEGEWVAFTDDDCVPERDWLVELIGEARRAGADVVVGRTRPDPERVHLLAEPFARSVRVESMTGYFHTCNILYRRSLVERLGGFDEEFRLIGDDTDLGWRAEEAGARAVFAPSAVVTHDVVVGTWRSDRASRRRWADVVRVIAKHPGARGLAWRPYVYRHTHLPILALGALSPLVLGGPRGKTVFAGALGALVLSDALRAGSPAAGLARLQGRISDAYEVAHLLRASWRERTLVL